METLQGTEPIDSGAKILDHFCRGFFTTGVPLPHLLLGDTQRNVAY